MTGTDSLILPVFFLVSGIAIFLLGVTLLRVGRTNVLTGPVSILPMLFPTTTAYPRPVYTALPSNR